MQIAFWKSSGWSAFHVQRVRKNSKIFGGRTYCCGEVSEIEHTLNISTPLPFTKKYFLKIKIKNIFRVSLCSCLLPLLVAFACRPRLPVGPGRTGSPAACKKLRGLSPAFGRCRLWLLVVTGSYRGLVPALSRLPDLSRIACDVRRVSVAGGISFGFSFRLSPRIMSAWPRRVKRAGTAESTYTYSILTEILQSRKISA